MSLRHFPTHLENIRGTGTANWKLDTPREDFRYSFVLLLSRLGLEPRYLSVPDFKSVIKVAVRELYQDTIYKSVRCVYQFRQRLIYLET